MTLAACLFALSGTASAQAVNGRNVVKVDYPSGNFKKTGTTWRESSGATFRETARDNWSVYLHDAARNVYIQLDLYTKNVKYRAGASGPYRNQYRIVNAFGPAAAPLPLPKQLTLTNGGVGNQGATINWTRDPNATSYELQIYVQGQLRKTVPVAGRLSKHTVNLQQLKQDNGIPAGQIVDFGFHIRGKNRTGNGVWGQSLHINN